MEREGEGGICRKRKKENENGRGSRKKIEEDDEVRLPSPKHFSFFPKVRPFFLPAPLFSHAPRAPLMLPTASPRCPALCLRGGIATGSARQCSNAGRERPR